MVLGLQTFTTLGHYRAAVSSLSELASQPDKGIVLARAVAAFLRTKGILLPTVDVMELTCSEVITRVKKRIHVALSDSLTRAHRQRLDGTAGPQRRRQDHQVGLVHVVSASSSASRCTSLEIFSPDSISCLRMS